mgnify:CR=1 FL=1
MNNIRTNKAFKVISVILAVLIIFNTVDFILSEITDIWAYEDATGNDVVWNEIVKKFEDNIQLTDEDYDEIFSQSGLGKPAVEKLLADGNFEKINDYRDYYLTDKDYYCYRKGVFACHEAITDSEGERINNPEFADLQKGDIIVTLSIHSLGWRHGHATIVTDAESGMGVQAVMVGEKSNNTFISSWKKYPLVAVLRPKVDENTRNKAGQFAQENLKGIYYSLFAGIFTGRNFEEIPITTQCAHLVWYAYMSCGVNVAPESGRIITPKDFLKSEKLEIVQVYGNITEV